MTAILSTSNIARAEAIPMTHADEAHRLRIVHHVYAPEILREETKRIAEEISKFRYGIRFLAAPVNEPIRLCCLYWERAAERQEWLTLLRKALCITAKP